MNDAELDLGARFLALTDQLIQAGHGVDRLLGELGQCARDLGQRLSSPGPSAGHICGRTLGQLVSGTGNVRPAAVLTDPEIERIAEFMAWHDDDVRAEWIEPVHLAAVVKYLRLLEVRLARQATEAPV